MKFIVVTGGIISGLGKGITASSIGLLFKSVGLNVTAIKIDPYLNIDAGTISPNEHGECYVLDDGYEADLDMGNYERFLNIKLTRDHNITTGQIYNKIIQDERIGLYLGKTVQIIPHVTNEIKRRILIASEKRINNMIPTLCIIEVGGTVGDMEISPFIEALRQMKYIDGYEMYFIHLGMVIEKKGEIKTKPLQHSVSICRTLGIYPDMLVIRSKYKLSQMTIAKINTFCQVPIENIISNYDTQNIYFVPELFMKQNILATINKKLQMLDVEEYNLNSYNKIISFYNTIETKTQVKLAIVAKYLNSQDTYLSLIRAIEHASFKLDLNVNITWLDSENYNDELIQYDGFIVPGGFGTRGIVGKLNVIKFARQYNKPILGICLGMQIMVVDIYNITSFGRSKEWEDCEYFANATDIIDIINSNEENMGNTMRLGNKQIYLHSQSKTYNFYSSTIINERHRHRYNINHRDNNIISTLINNGMVIAGTSVGENKFIEVIEYNANDFYVGCQYHPEFNTSYENPHILFIQLLSAMHNIAHSV